jgi:hypothetical protein
LIEEEDLKRKIMVIVQWSSCNKDIYLVFMELRCFSSMLPSIPKGKIVRMNAGDITMGGYPSIAGAFSRFLV